MPSYRATRQQRPAIASVVVGAHLLMAWLCALLAMGGTRENPLLEVEPIYTDLMEQAVPRPLGKPAPVEPTLAPITFPQPPTPALQSMEIALDAPTPGPDPGPSSPQPATRPATDSGEEGFPGDKGLKVVRRVAPIYPRDSVLRGEAGLVQMRARVNARGEVLEVQLVGSSGFSSLDTVAMRAVGKWRFEPELQEGRPVGAWTLVNLRMSTYQQSYCRIRDEPSDGAKGEDVHDAAVTATPGEAAMQRLINDLVSGALPAPPSLQAQLRDWGAVQAIHYVNDAGYQGWVTRDILPAYRGTHSGNTVQVRWDAYGVQQEKIVTRWIVATDSSGEVWCVRIGKAVRP